MSVLVRVFGPAGDVLRVNDADKTILVAEGNDVQVEAGDNTFESYDGTTNSVLTGGPVTVYCEAGTVIKLVDEEEM